MSQYGTPPPGGNPPPGNNQPPGGYGGYGQQPGYPPAKQGSGLAIAALVVGILAVLSGITVLGGILLGLVAIVLGAIASSKAKKGTGGGRGMAIAGIVLGVLGLVIAGAIIALGVSIFGDINSCVDDAGGDQAAINQCEKDFNEKYNN